MFFLTHTLSLILILSSRLYYVLSDQINSKPVSRFLAEGVYATIAEGYWGDWTLPLEVPNGYLACGLGLRVEAPQGEGDDTAANAVKIKYCKTSEWNNQSEIVLNQGLWGDWIWGICPEGYFVHKVMAKVEAPQGTGDDTALNALSFRCKDPVTSYESNAVLLYNTVWGDWINWVEVQGKYVCGGQVRFESSQGVGDDTALNGIRLKFCDFTI